MVLLVIIYIIERRKNMSMETKLADAINDTLRNPLYEAMKELGIGGMLKASNFVKQREGKPLGVVLLHFLYMLVMNKKISAYVSQSQEGYTKDVYYRFLRNPRYNWRRLLSTLNFRILQRIEPLQKADTWRVLILDDTVNTVRGLFREGSREKLWSNNQKRFVRGINVVSLNLSDGLSNLLLDFAIAMGPTHASVALAEFTQKLDHRLTAAKRRREALLAKPKLALAMIERALKQGIRADYLLIDSWYSKPSFLQEVNTLGLSVVTRLANNTTIWNFTDKARTLEGLYRHYKPHKKLKRGEYGKQRFTYFSVRVDHRKAGVLRILFIQNGTTLIPLATTDLSLGDERIIELYRRRWDIEQGYKDLREHFAFGKEENRLYEALIARITLSFFTYNLVSYLNRIQHEPQTLGGLLKDLECELHTLTITMQTFLLLLEKVVQIDGIVKRNEDFTLMIDVLRSTTQEMLGFRCES